MLQQLEMMQGGWWELVPFERSQLLVQLKWRVMVTVAAQKMVHQHSQQQPHCDQQHSLTHGRTRIDTWYHDRNVLWFEKRDTILS